MLSEIGPVRQKIIFYAEYLYRKQISLILITCTTVHNNKMVSKECLDFTLSFDVVAICDSL